MKFGLSQMWKQTPLVISRAKRAINVLAFSILPFMPKLCEWYDWTEDGVMTAIGLSGLFINIVGLMFGVEEVEEEKE